MQNPRHACNHRNAYEYTVHVVGVNRNQVYLLVLLAHLDGVCVCVCVGVSSCECVTEGPGPSIALPQLSVVKSPQLLVLYIRQSRLAAPWSAIAKAQRREFLLQHRSLEGGAPQLWSGTIVGGSRFVSVEDDQVYLSGRHQRCCAELSFACHYVRHVCQLQGPINPGLCCRRTRTFKHEGLR